MGKAEIGKTASNNPARNLGKMRRPAERRALLCEMFRAERCSALHRQTNSRVICSAQVVDFTLNPA
jgi:hypothetical protein